MLTRPEVLLCCYPRSQGYFSRTSSDRDRSADSQQHGAGALSTAGEIAIVSVCSVVDQKR